MKIQLSDHFTYSRLLRFVFPSIVMMIFTSIYSVVDGFFVSNFVGKTPFAALNLIFPFLMLFGAVGFMLGTGGSALVAMRLGEGEQEQANRLFSMLVLVAVGIGTILAVLGVFLLRPVAIALGAEGELLENCLLYGRILLSSTPAFILQYVFQSFLVAAEKPQNGLKITVAAGLTNIVLDVLFIAVFRWELAGAALATACSQIVGGIVPLVYFLLPNHSLLRLTRPCWDGKALLHACTNGSSEMVSNLSMSLIGMLYNLQLMRLAGENGVSAYGIIQYANFIFIAVFLGYAIGSAPVISFHLGAGNRQELRSLLRKSLVILLISGVTLTLIGIVFARPLAMIFVSYDAELLEMTIHGFALYAFSFLFIGFNIFGSSFFTALNNGLISAIISFLRTFVFQLISILLLPIWLEIDGVWLAMLLAEGLALVVTFFFLFKMRKKYGYA